MKRTTLLFTLLLATGAAQASDHVWLAEPDMTPTSLSSTGAALTETDSLLWPDGKTVVLTYGLGANDVTFRCAELRDGEATSPSCWRREDVVTLSAHAGTPAGRTISTRRRAHLPSYCQPYVSHPYLWVGLDY